MKNRLSSDNLYHFKSDVGVLNSILTNGFRHSMWPESIPYKKSLQQNFMVCFCDIKIEEAEYHRKCYGDNAIVLSKEWGITKGISPVKYIHAGSHDISQNYIKIKNRFREILRESNFDQDTFLTDYSIFSVLLDTGKLPHDSLNENINNNNHLLTEMEMLEKEFLKMFAETKPLSQDKVITKYFRSLISRILDLHKELEKRDAFMRAYSEDFTHPSTTITYPNKILYDEREWRSIIHPKPNELLVAMNNKFLQSNYNLTFTDKDILAILLKDQTTWDSVKDYIQKNKTLLDPTITIPKLKIIDMYKEA